MFKINRKVLIEIKYTGITLIISLIMLTFTSCTHSPPLRLRDVHASILTDGTVTAPFVLGNEDDLILFVPTVLHYRFVLENTSRKKIGSTHNPIQLSIEHNTSLIPDTVMSGNEEGKSGVGQTYVGLTQLAANEVGEFIVYYKLGVKDTKGINTVAQIPERDILDEMESRALDAVLIIFVGEEELTRINLNEYKN